VDTAGADFPLHKTCLVLEQSGVMVRHWIEIPLLQSPDSCWELGFGILLCHPPGLMLQHGHYIQQRGQATIWALELKPDNMQFINFWLRNTAKCIVYRNGEFQTSTKWDAINWFIICTYCWCEHLQSTYCKFVFASNSVCPTYPKTFPGVFEGKLPNKSSSHAPP